MSGTDAEARAGEAVGDRWGGAGGVRRRATWSLVDQALSSLTNFAMSLIAARVLAPREFGAFAVAFATYIVCLNLNRAFATDPLLVRYSGATHAERRQAVPAVMGTVAVFSLVSSLCFGVAAAVLPWPANIAFLAFAVAQPGILVQDSWRYVFFADGRPQLSAANDLIWTVVQALLTVLAFTTGHKSLLWLTATWGAAAWVAAGAGFVQFGCGIAPRRAASWVLQQRDLALRYAADVVTLLGVAQLGLYGLGFLTGLTAVGSIRAAQVLLGPLTFISLGGSIIIVPEGVRLRARAPERLKVVLASYSATMVVICVTWVALASLLGDRLGTDLVGENWQGVRSVLVPVGAIFVFNSLAFGGVLGLRVLADARRALRARLIVAPFTLSASLVGAALGGARGFALGTAGGTGVGAIVWWVAYSRSEAAFASPPGRAEPEPLIAGGDLRP
jgi:O-antigen/teichoic acid export membrane protein